MLESDDETLMYLIYLGQINISTNKCTQHKIIFLLSTSRPTSITVTTKHSVIFFIVHVYFHPINDLDPNPLCSMQLQHIAYFGPS